MEEFNITQVDFQSLKQVDIRTVDVDTLVDIRNININTELPKEQRILEFIRKVGNPYCFKVDKVAVSVDFSNDGVTFEQRMKHYLQTL